MLIHTAAGALGALAEGVDAGHSGSKLLQDVGYGAISGFAGGTLGFMGGFAHSMKNGVQFVAKKNILGRVVVTTKATIVAKRTEAVVRLAFSTGKIYTNRDEYLARAKKSYASLLKVMRR
jgi:hypothetical protein